MVAGTKGYEKAVEEFAEVSFKLDFATINREFLAFLPPTPSRVLDAGSGVGQNSAAFEELGYDVVAVEPLHEFLSKAKDFYQEKNITWLGDSLPYLKKVNVDDGMFSFVLLDGVWHHLNPEERQICIARISSLLSVGGVCAISLRSGPAGVGTHIFPTSCIELFEYADTFGFDVVYHIENQPSVMPNKVGVFWAKVALMKKDESLRPSTKN
ncbi:class I SAM-dependent methyltransferase [Veronia pacifica]|uniref:Methyltransferase type 11 n=1 Tax=Veronia pacifica TaxID=1080227 RepID=A0A1C3EAK3_9GAMM|nr:class I SAM-dependent methyltransferase [Veronia pacifica]ODA30276.1 methyltransferase type 11 [Veronia pacifica]